MNGRAEEVNAERLVGEAEVAELCPGEVAPVPVPWASQGVIGGLCGSPMHRTAVGIYLRHHDAGTGVCAQCGHRAPCAAGRHAAAVIVAAGEDPRGYRGHPLPRPAASDLHRERRPGPGAAKAAAQMEVTGYRLGGVGRRADVPYVGYER